MAINYYFVMKGEYVTKKVIYYFGMHLFTFNTLLLHSPPPVGYTANKTFIRH